MATADTDQKVEFRRQKLVDLVPADVNPRRGHVASIQESLQAHGQFAPLLIQKSSSKILKGNHTYKALLLEGWIEADTTIIDVDDDEAQRILLIDNRTSDKGTYDQQELADLLDSIATSSKGFAGTGWDPDEYDDLLAALDAMPVMDDQGTDASWAYTDEELAARTAQRQQSMGDTALHEVTLYFKKADFLEYKNAIKGLQRHFGDVSAAEALLATFRSHPATEGTHDSEPMTDAQKHQIAPLIEAAEADLSAGAETLGEHS
jgi:hypothetical protein